MGNDEQKAFELLNRNRLFQKPIIEEYGGLLIKEMGDGIMASFPTVSDAILAAMKIQKACTDSKDISLRIGIHYGEIIFENNDIYGDAVNIASRIQTIGIPGSVLFSKKVNDEISNKSAFQTISMGNYNFKNVNNSIEVFALSNEGFPIPRRNQMDGKLKKGNTRIPVFLFIIVGLLAAAFLINKYYHINQVAEHRDKSIAVLPFVNMSADKEQEYFSEGMMEEILNQLAKIGELKVSSRTSSNLYKNSTLSLKDIANSLGVANILEGSVRKSGDKVRITVQLIDAGSDKHLWSETFDREMKDIFAIQTDIATQIANVLKTKLSPEEQKQIAKKPQRIQKLISFI